MSRCILTLKALVLIEVIFFTICLHRACVVKAPPCKGWHGNQGQEVNQCQLKKWSPRRRREKLCSTHNEWEGYQYLVPEKGADLVARGRVRGSDVFSEMLI